MSSILYFLLALLCATLIVVWLGLIYDAAKKQKYMWIFLLLIFNFVAVIPYYITEYKADKKTK